MSIELIKVNSAWCIIDKAVPGWRTVESHGQKSIAEARLRALTMTRGVEYLENTSGAAVLAGAGDAPPDLLAVFLDGSVRDVRARIVACADVETLKALLEAEEQDTGRKTVIKALRSRLSALA